MVDIHVSPKCLYLDTMEKSYIFRENIIGNGINNRRTIGPLRNGPPKIHFFPFITTLTTLVKGGLHNEQSSEGFKDSCIYVSTNNYTSLTKHHECSYKRSLTACNIHDIIHLQLTQYYEEPKLNKNKTRNGLTCRKRLKPTRNSDYRKVSFLCFLFFRH